MNNHVLQMMVWLCVLYASNQSQSNIPSTDLIDTTTPNSAISSTVIPIELTSSPLQTTSAFSSFTTSTVTSTAIPATAHETDTPSTMSSITVPSVVPTSLPISTSFSHPTSIPPVSPTTTSIQLVYGYIVSSPRPLMKGNITNSTVLMTVHNMVRSSFNLSNFMINVTRTEIRSRTRMNSEENDLITDILFATNRTDCNAACIKASVATSSSQTFTLPDANGALVNVTVKSGPTLVEPASDVTPAPINYKKGESPPGLAARLGMGFGITIISVLLIAEIIYLHRKYGLSGSMREASYEIPSYNNQ